MLVVVLLWITCAAAQLPAAPGTEPPAADLEKSGLVVCRFPRWVYPRIEFHDATLKEVADYLAMTSKEISPDGKV